MNRIKMQAGSRKKDAVAARRNETARAAPVHAGPSGAALRLLRALSEPGAEAMCDPTREGSVIVSGGQGISLGRGSFASGLARDLARRDLVAATGKGEKSRYAISAAGRAHLKRRAGASDSVFRTQHGEIVAGEI